MTHLGSFQAAAREIDPAAEVVTFDFYGETFIVHNEVPAIVELTLSAALAGKVGGVVGDAAVYEALRHALTPPVEDEGGKPDRSQWERFYKIAVDHEAPSSVLTSLTLNIMAADLGRPTVRPSTSSPGQPPTSTSSNSSSLPSPDAPAFRPVSEVLGG